MIVDRLQTVFDGAYTNRIWGEKGNGSGDGSEPEGNTYMRRILMYIIQKYNIRSICDAPCGAGKWIDVFLKELSDQGICIRYYGVDVAKEAVESSRKLLEKHKGKHEITVVHGDLTTDPLPQGFDLVFSRDALQHLSYGNIAKCLKNMSDANAKWCIIGGYWPGENKNIKDGAYFSFNITQHPFLLKPHKIFSEEHDEKEEKKHLFLFTQDMIERIDWSNLSQRITQTRTQLL